MTYFKFAFIAVWPAKFSIIGKAKEKAKKVARNVRESTLKNPLQTAKRDKVEKTKYVTKKVESKPRHIVDTKVETSNEKVIAKKKVKGTDFVINTFMIYELPNLND